MLSQRLSQHGVITDLTQVGSDDVASMASRAESAKQQAQYATAYARTVKSALKSMVKIAKTQADLYKDAHGALKEVDGHKLAAYRTELAHQTHMVRMEAKRQGVELEAKAKQASVVEIEQAKTQGRLLKIGYEHQRALKAATPKRKGLLSGLWN